MDLENKSKNVKRTGLMTAARMVVGLGLAGFVASLGGCATFLEGFVYGAADESARQMVREGRHDQEEKSLQRHVVACNYLQADPNHNGTLDYPTEFVGLKSVFKVNERIILVCYDPYSKKGQNLRMDLRSPKGRLVRSEEGLISRDREYRTAHVTPGNLVSQDGYGEYEVSFYSNDQFVGSTKFAIVPPE